MASILPMDELNRVDTEIRERFGNTKLEKRDEEDVIDMLLDLFLLAYATGRSVTNENLSSNYNPSLDEIMKVVDAEVAGKTWRQRVEDTAKFAGAKRKTWATMLDDRVRETHEYLEGQTVGMDDDFYTYDGDHAPAPGLFELAENNVNCRCELLFS